MATANFLTHAKHITHKTLDEEIILTFQVVLIGRDGLVVGSDRKMSFRSPTPDVRGYSAGAWQFAPSTKFVKSTDESVICACAGGPQAKSIANSIVLSCAPVVNESAIQWEEWLRHTSDAVVSNSVGDEVIVVRRNFPDHAIVLCREERTTGVLRIETALCTGTSLTARFLTQHLWQLDTVDNLERLALLSLAYAVKERPSEVGEGFDIMTLRTSGNVSWRHLEPNDSDIPKTLNAFDASTKKFLFPAKNKKP